MDEERYMSELHADMEKEQKFQKFRQGMMNFCLGGGIALMVASAHDWRQLVSAVVITAVSELVLWVEG